MERVVDRVRVKPNGPLGVFAEEPSTRRVIVAGPGVVEAGGGGIAVGAVGIGTRAGALRDAVSRVAEGRGDRAGRIRKRGDRAGAGKQRMRVVEPTLTSSGMPGRSPDPRVVR